jgi:large repetitive protein
VRRARSPAVVVAICLAATLAGVVRPGTAYAAGSTLFDNTFADPAVDGTGTVTVPTPAGKPNSACLTAKGNSATLPLLSCAGATDNRGGGRLRLTDTSATAVGGIFGQDTVPTSAGLDITFNSYQWGGGAADGIAFVLAAVDPANPAAPAAMGPAAGSLGYAPAAGTGGLADGYLGVGLDVLGDYSGTSASGTGCSNPATISGQVAGAAVVRGPGNGPVGYCGLSTTYDGTAGSRLTLRGATRAASVVPVEVLLNPTAAPLTAGSGVVVAAGSYKVVLTPVGQSARTLAGSLPAAATTLYPSASWLTAAGVPRQLAFGFAGTTGSAGDVHEVGDVRVLTFNPTARLAVSGTSYSAATSVPGDAVTYQTTVSVLAGADTAGPVSVTHTTPIGVLPLAGYGSGWTCQSPVGRAVTCTSTGSPVGGGTALPAVTVVAIATGASVPAAVVQTATTILTYAADTGPATDTAMTVGTAPSAPNGVVVSPTIGPVTGGNAVVETAVLPGGIPPIALEIGTVAEFQAGTPAVLLPCTAGRAPGCFNIEGTSMYIASMPARATAATVSLTLVTLGTAAGASYQYVAPPATPEAPTATAGITSATVTWTAPAGNGSALTGYVVTPYLGGVAQTALNFDASATTRTLTGLTAGGSYQFTVAAVNAYGTSAESARSAAVVPYALPGAPSITAATAGDSAATLTWTTPANGGSAITGYAVIPYIGAAAGTAQTFTGGTTTRTVTGLTPGTAYTFTVAAQNQAGTGPASAPSAAVTPNVSPSLTFADPAAGEVGVAYHVQLAVTDGTSPFTWSLSSGTLPGGLSLNAFTGLLSGTPTAAGTFPVTVRVVDASGQSATRSVTLVVVAAPSLTFTPPAGEVSVGYSAQPARSGGTGPFSWAVTAGSLPTGVTLNASTGLVSGTPTAAGSFAVTIAVTDTFNQVANTTGTIVIAALPAFSGAAPPDGKVGVGYSATLAVSGGTAPLTWSVTAGSLPPGLALSSSTGLLSGTPTTAGSYPFTASVSDANGKSATRAVTLVIAAGPLVIAKTADTTSAVAGGTVAYTITVTNTGATTWTGAVLSDPLAAVLDDAAYNADATASAGTLSYAAGVLGWTGNIAAGGTVTIGYSVTVADPDLGNKVLANTVTSTTLGTNCAAGSGDGRCSATVTVPGLSILKAADVATTTPGGTVHFSIVVSNTGQTAYPAATLTDNLAGVLDDATYQADGTATAGSLSHAGASLTWTGALGVGASATITYSVIVADPDTGDRNLTGTVVSASPASPCPAQNPAAACTASVTVLVPGLAVSTSAGASTTTPGGTVAYTLSVSNTGQTGYPAATTVTLALGAALDDAGYGGDAAATAGSVAFDAGTGRLTWTGGLAVGASVTITASVQVLDPDTGDRTLTTVATSAAPGSTCPAGAFGPPCTTTVRVLIPELTITASADTGTTTPGSVLHYTVSATNTGQTDLPGAALADDLSGVLDDAGYAADATATTGSVSVSGSTLTWSGDLATGASATVAFSVRVHDPDGGDRSLRSAVTSATPGSTCPAGGSDPRCATSIAVLLPGLSFTGALDPTTSTPGSVVGYSLTVTNTGQTAYHDLAVTLDLTGTVDDATYNEDAAISTGSLVGHPDGTVAWVLDLASGASATGTISFTVNRPDTGDRSLHVAVVSDAAGSPCPTGSTDPACDAAATILVPGLTITQAADSATASPGGQVGYTITVVNDGETDYAAATVTDDLSDLLEEATYGGDATATGGTLGYAAPVLSWTGALATGAAVTITFSVTVLDPDPGDKLAVNTAVSAAPGSNCPAGSADPRCTTVLQVLVPGLRIVTTAGTATTIPGAVVGHTVTVTNTGDTPYAGAAFSDSLAGLVDDAGYNGDAAASAGTAGFAAGAVTWSGDLAVGATATITYSVTVHGADGGDNLLTDAVTSATPGSNCGAGSGDARCTATVPVARLVVDWAGTPGTGTPGAEVRLAAHYTNTGQVPYVGITVSADAGDVTDDALPAGDETASSGTLYLTATGIAWTGSIPVGGVVVLGATVTVRNPDPGNRTITATAVSAAPGNNCPEAGTDPRCTASIAVLVPELTIAKTADATATVPGGQVGYTITVHNTGQTDYTGATVTDAMAGILDEADYDGNAEASTGSVSVDAATLSWTGDLAVGETATITYSVTVHTAVGGDNTLVNVVSSAAAGSTCAPAGDNPACRSVVAVLSPGLTIVTTATVANATLGSTVGYTVTVTDSGQTSYPAAALTDDLAGVLDDATYNAGDTTASSGTLHFTDGVLIWSGALAPGESATIGYTVTINNPATGDLSMPSTAVSGSGGSNCPAGAADTRCTATVAVTEAVSLTFTKTADVAATAAGAQVHYTVTVVNSSGSAVDPANFTDPLAGILDDASYDGNAAATDGTVAFTEPDLTWTGAVPAGGTVTVTYSVTVHGTPTGDQILTGTVSSTSLPASDNCLAASTDPRCASTVPVAALLIQQGYAQTATTPGATVHLSATFTNTGQLPYYGISVSSPTADTVDDAIPAGDQIATSGTLSLTATDIIWTGNIPVGGTVTVTGSLTVMDPDPGDRQITGTLVSAALGSNCPDGGTDTRCTALSTVLLPALTISKSADSTAALAGGTVGYTITIHNSGEAPYAGATVTDLLEGVLDEADYDADADATIGSVSYTSPDLTWTGDLDVGATAVVTYSVTIAAGASGDKEMVNAVSSTEAGSTCPPASGNEACRSLVAVLTPALTIVSAVSATTAVPGAVLTYTLTAANTGQVPYPAASISAPLAGVLDDATYGGDASADVGTIGLLEATLTWTGALDPGDVVTITYTVTVNPPAGGDFRLEQSVTSAASGSTCPAEGTDPRCTTDVAVAGLRITTTADAATTRPTAVVGYTLTIANIGQVPYVGISVTADFSGILDDATYNGDAQATTGSLAFNLAANAVTWTGDLAPGASAAVTGSATVNNPDLGDRTLATLASTGAAASNCPTGGDDPACATAVAVLIPELTISKAADTSTTTPGSVVGYTITVADTGQTPYTAAAVRDPLAGILNGATYRADAAATTGDVAFADSTLTWTGDLAVGQDVVITFTIRVNDPDLGDKTIVNRVVSDEVGSPCHTGGSDPDCFAVVAVLVPALDIVVAADATSTTPGSVVGYTVTITNSGQTASGSVSVTAALAGALDDASYPGDATATAGSVAIGGTDLTWSGELATGATAVVSYSLTVADPDAGDRVLTTSLTSAAPGSGCTGAAPCVHTVTVLIPGLAVTTTASPATATPGDRVVFTITLSNTGETPYPDAVATTALDGTLDDAGVVTGTVQASIGVASYTAPTLTWTGTLHVGDVAVISYAVTVHSPDTGDRQLSAAVTADLPGSTCPAGGDDPACAATVGVLVPALSIRAFAGTASTTPGSEVGYTIEASNTGQTGYAGVSIDDSLAGVLPDADYGGDAVVTAGGGTLSYTGSTLTWTGDLAVGASVSIGYTVTVHDPDTGDKLMVNTVTSAAPGSTCPPGGDLPDCASQVRVLVPALSITKAADTVEVAAGGAVHYTVSLRNDGQTGYAPAVFTDSLAGVLDDASYAGDAAASTGSVRYDAGTLTWTGSLDTGESASITYSVTTGYPATGDHTLANTVSSPAPGATCPTGSEPGCGSAVTVLVPALSIAKAADTTEVVSGGTVHYSISATNTGQADYPAVTLTDALDGVTDDAGYNGDATATVGTVSYSGGTLSWTGALPVAASALISYSVTTPATPTGTGDDVLVNRVESAAVGGNCAAGSLDPRCATATAVAARTLTVSGLTPAFTLNGLPDSTVTADGALTMTVTTNSPGGYLVTSQPASGELTGAAAGNTATIPIGRLSVRESGTSQFQPLSLDTPRIVHQQSAPSAPGGDAISNDYQVDIPDVASDTYSATLEYIVITQ